MVLLIVTSVSSYLPIYVSSYTFKLAFTYQSPPLHQWQPKSLCEQRSEGCDRTPCL